MKTQNLVDGQRDASERCPNCHHYKNNCCCPAETMAMTDEQDRNYESAVRHAADTIDSQAASDTRYILAKLDVARAQIKERDLIIQRLSSRYWPQEMQECLLAIINLDEKGMSPSNALIDRAKAAIGYCVSARCSNDKLRDAPPATPESK